jgi:hypothetical protein
MQTRVQPVAHSPARGSSAAKSASPQRRRVKKELPPPAAAQGQQAPLFTVSSSSVATSADGGIVALVLKTEETGPIAFQVTVEACAVLRCQIAIAETLLNPRKRRLGRAAADSVPSLDGPDAWAGLFASSRPLRGSS